MLGGVIVHVAPIGHAFVKVVSFGLHRSFCETCGRITGTRGGYALAVRSAHFLATSAVTADALPFMHPTAMQTNPTSALSNFTWANMVYPKAKHRGLIIAGLTVSVACIATKSHSATSAQCPVCPRLCSLIPGFGVKLSAIILDHNEH